MPPFTDLSNELYLEILQHLPPPDFGSFYCVNKHLYALTATHRIRHQELKRRFSNLDTKQPGSTARLIKRISGDPKIALYVQHFTINGCREEWDWQDYPINNERLHVEYPASLMVQLEHAVQDSEYIPNDERDMWIESFKDGDEDGLIALALTLLPNLTSIEFQSSTSEDPWALTMITRIAEANAMGGHWPN